MNIYKNYVMSNRDSLAPLIEKMKPLNVKVLNVIILKDLGFGNVFLLNQTELAGRIGISRRHMVDCIKDLVAENFIKKVKKQGGMYYYMLNPEFYYMGEKSAKKKIVEDFENLETKHK